MSLEQSVNQYGQDQVITNFDKLIKIGNKFLQVRLIQTRKWGGKDWKNRPIKNRGFTKPMPRAKFIQPEIDSQIENPYYLIRKSDLEKIKQNFNLDDAGEKKW